MSEVAGRSSERVRICEKRRISSVGLEDDVPGSSKSTSCSPTSANSGLAGTSETVACQPSIPSPFKGRVSRSGRGIKATKYDNDEKDIKIPPVSYTDFLGTAPSDSSPNKLRMTVKSTGYVMQICIDSYLPSELQHSTKAFDYDSQYILARKKADYYQYLVETGQMVPSCVLEFLEKKGESKRTNKESLVLKHETLINNQRSKVSLKLPELKLVVLIRDIKSALPLDCSVDHDVKACVGYMERVLEISKNSVLATKRSDFVATIDRLRYYYGPKTTRYSSEFNLISFEKNVALIRKMARQAFSNIQKACPDN